MKFMRFDEVVEIITARDARFGSGTCRRSLTKHSKSSEELQFGDENFGNFHRSLFHHVPGPHRQCDKGRGWHRARGGTPALFLFA